MLPDLTTYNWIVINSSAGKDPRPCSISWSNKQTGLA
jgi:hypothetical protein